MYRSVLDENCTVFNHCYAIDTDHNERIRRNKFVYFFLFKLHLSKNRFAHQESLVGLQSLKIRPQNHLIILVFKILNNKIDCPHLL